MICSPFRVCVCSWLPGDSGSIWSWGGGDFQSTVARRDPRHHLRKVLTSRWGARGCSSAGASHPYRMDYLQQPWAVQRHAQDQSRVGQSGVMGLVGWILKEGWRDHIMVYSCWSALKLHFSYLSSSCQTLVLLFKQHEALCALCCNSPSLMCILLHRTWINQYMWSLP